MAGIDDEEHYREAMAQEAIYDRFDRARKADERAESPTESEDERATRYWSALCMIARHPCHASGEDNPDWHCGECAACVAKDALRGIS